MTRWLGRIVAVLMALYFVGGVVLYQAQDKLVFPQTVNTIVPPDADHPADLAYLSLTTPDGVTLNGLGFNLHPGVPQLLIAFGGNAHDVTGMVRFLRDSVVAGRDVAVAGYSYRGYPNALGRPSGGHPSEANLHADARLIYDTLTAEYHPQQVGVVGYSLGTAVATRLAVERPVAAVALAAPFASILRIAQSLYHIYPVAWMLNHPFKLEDDIGHIAAPVTVISSPADGLIPPGHIGILAARNPSASFVTLNPPVGHSDVLNHPAIPALLRQALGL